MLIPFLQDRICRMNLVKLGFEILSGAFTSVHRVAARPFVGVRGRYPRSNPNVISTVHKIYVTLSFSFSMMRGKYSRLGTTGK